MHKMLVVHIHQPPRLRIQPQRIDLLMDRLHPRKQLLIQKNRIVMRRPLGRLDLVHLLQRRVRVGLRHAVEDLRHAGVQLPALLQRHQRVLEGRRGGIVRNRLDLLDLRGHSGLQRGLIVRVLDAVERRRVIGQRARRIERVLRPKRRRLPRRMSRLRRRVIFVKLTRRNPNILAHMVGVRTPKIVRRPLHSVSEVYVDEAHMADGKILEWFRRPDQRTVASEVATERDSHCLPRKQRHVAPIPPAPANTAPAKAAIAIRKALFMLISPHTETLNSTLTAKNKAAARVEHSSSRFSLVKNQ